VLFSVRDLKQLQGLLLPCGERNFRSIPYAVNIRAPLVAGCILSVSRPLATFWLLQVGHLLVPVFSVLSLTEPVGHDSTINIVYPGGPTIYSIRSNSLPYISLTWTSEDAIVAAGHDCQPVLFSGGPSGWQAAGSLDDTTAPKSSVGGARGGFTGSSPVGRLNSAAFNTFRNADSRGMGSSHGGGTPLATDTELFTVHQNTITNIRPYDGPPGAVSRVSTSGVDGKLVIWSVNAVSGLGTKLKALRVG
jgi:hypothetical protein